MSAPKPDRYMQIYKNVQETLREETSVDEAWINATAESVIDGLHFAGFLYLGVPGERAYLPDATEIAFGEEEHA